MLYNSKYFKVPPLSAPSFFPIMSLLPMRCMLYAKENLPYEKYEDAFGELWQFLWREHKDVSKPEVLAECLGRHFGREDVERSECYFLSSCGGSWRGEGEDCVVLLSGCDADFVCV